MSREDEVRATLASRPAGIINGASRDAKTCFAGLFNGARREGWFPPAGGLFIGKSECETTWPQGWEELRDLGLLEYSIDERRNHPEIGGSTTYLTWRATDKGWEVRQDDVAWFHDLMDAMHEDRLKPPAPAPSGALPPTPRARQE